MNLNSVKTWISKNATGLSGLGVVAAGAAASVVSHNIPTIAGVSLFVGAVIHLIIPKNDAAATAGTKLFQDAYTAIATRKVAESLPTIMADTIAELQALYPPAPVVVAAPVTTVTTTTTAQTVEVAPVAAPVVQPAAVAA